MRVILIGLGLIGIVGVNLNAPRKEETYTETIAPIFNAKCLPCHGRTKAGPFDFSTYESVKSKIELIRTQVLSKNMPPIWVHSDYAKLSEVEPVTDEEAVSIQRWIQKGMPKGPQAPPYLTEGPIEFPDKKLDYHSKVKVKREGAPYWEVTTIALPKSGGSFSQFCLLPSSPLTTRYAIVAIVPASQKVPKTTAGSLNLPGSQLVGVWAPGYRNWALPRGFARKYPPNSKFVVQSLLRPSGKSESTDYRVELYRWIGGGVQPTTITFKKDRFDIPAGKSKIIELTHDVKKDTSILSILPEARFYAGRVQLVYTRAGEPDKMVYDNVRWDPYWVGNYSPEKPIKLAKGGKLIARFHYSNDENCRMNEGKKPTDVKSGPTTADEVCRMHLLITP